MIYIAFILIVTLLFDDFMSLSYIIKSIIILILLIFSFVLYIKREK